MKNILNKFIAGASIMALSFSLSINNTYASVCDTVPTCADLGYDKTSCAYGFDPIKCPFDTTKVNCIPNENRCSTLGYASTSCSNNSIKLKCPYNSAKLTCVPIITDFVEMNECQVGDFVYAYTSNPGSYNYTKAMCNSRLYNQYDTSSMSTENYLLLGIVLDTTNHIAVDVQYVKMISSYLTGKQKWAVENVDYPGLANVPSDYSSDTNGYQNTQYLYNYYHNDRSSVANICAAISGDPLPRARKYFLPASGEAYKLSSVREQLYQIDPFENHDQMYWTSTPASTTQAWMYDLTEGTTNIINKDVSSSGQYEIPSQHWKTKCFFEYY